MTGASSARPGDIVACDIKGRAFFGMVEPRDADSPFIKVTPMTKGTTHFHVSVRDVRAIWRFSRGTKPLVTKGGSPAWGKA